MYPTPSPSPSFLKLTFVSILFSFLYAGVAFFAGALFGLFAMGCGGSCATSTFPTKVISVAIVVFVLLLSVHVIWLKKLYSFFSWKIILWILISLITILATGPIVSFAVLNLGNKTAEKQVQQIYAPYLYSKNFHPRITFINSESVKNSETGEISQIKVRVIVESKEKARLNLVGGLYQKIQDSEYVANDPEHYDEVFIDVSPTPTEVSFTIKPNSTKKYAMPLGNYSIFGIYATYNGDADKFRVEPYETDFPVDDVDDSGNSGEALLPDNDDRTVFYSISKN